MLKYLILIFLFAARTLSAQVYVQKQQAYADTFTTGGKEDTKDTEAAAVIPRQLQSDSLPMEMNKRSISSEQWQQLTIDPVFRYDDPVKTEVREEEGPGMWAMFLLAIADFFTSGVGMVLLWGILGVALVYIVFRLVKMRGNLFFAKADKKIGKDADEYSDEYIPEDWEQAINDAAASGNYRLAVRHSYRYLLSLLSDKQKISYQPAKTNYQYAYELNGTDLYQPFLQMTRGYEYAWYGGFDMPRQQFEYYYNQLKKIQSGLS